MIEYHPGADIFESEAEAMVNPVNCVGVMGKGLALEFKKRFPAMFEAYAKVVKDGGLRLGCCHLYFSWRLDGPSYIVNFPTKDHWSARSKIESIMTGLDHLAALIETHNIKSIAIPMLGCGEGGLNWGDVRPLIDDKLGDLDCEIEIYGPPEETV